MIFTEAGHLWYIPFVRYNTDEVKGGGERFR